LFLNLSETISNLSPVASIIISIALMLFCGFLMTRLTKLVKLPNVTAYIVVGLILGQIGIINPKVIDGMDFLSDIAVALISFSAGEYFRLSVLKQNGFKVVIITLCETLGASIIVFLLTYVLLHLSLPFALVLSALAAATTSASTMMNIKQTKSKGDFVNTLLQVVAIDNIIALLTYSVAISISSTIISGAKLNFIAIIKPLLINIGVILIGGCFGFLLKLFLQKRSNDNKLIIALATIFAFCGICAILDISPILGCMSMGLVYINVAKDEKLFKQLNYFSPPILLLFFVRSGINFDVSALTSSGAIGAVPLIIVSLLYFLFRIIGKYSGAFLGCKLMKKDNKTCLNLGLALVPQASVAISLATLGARTFESLGYPEFANALHTIIVASALLYEIVGPGCSKLALYFTKSYSNDIEELAPVSEIHENGEKKNDVQILIDRIKKIQETIPEHDTVSEEENAFDEAIEEQLNAYNNQNRNRQRNWRR